MEAPARYLGSTGVVWGGAVITIAAAVAGVLAVRAVAVRVLHPAPSFTPLSPGSPIVATAGCTLVAIYVFLGIISYPNAVHTWRLVSTVVLILSFLPCIVLAVSHVMGGGWPEAFALMMMHVVVWVSCAFLLPLAATTKHPRRTDLDDRPLSIR